ncbi:MAG TPA: hypothetical protein VGD00_04975 [Solirubrobacteraceae bacterium]
MTSVSSVPDGIALDRDRDLVGRARNTWVRRGLLCLIAVLPVLALLNVFGQHPTTTSASGPAASVNVTAPARLRSGLIFQVRVQVEAHRDIKELQLVFDRGWWESMSVNSTVPEPSEESSSDGRVVFDYGPLGAGHSHVSWLYFQVNPTNVAKRQENVDVKDGNEELVHIHRSMTIFP